MQFWGMHKHHLILAFLATGSFAAAMLSANAHSFDQNLLPRESLKRQDLDQTRRSKDYQPPAESRPSSELISGGTRYVPPDTSTGPRRSVPGATRGGCRGNAAIYLTALAPQHHAGQTVSTHPTLVWYVPDEAPYPIQVQLYRYASDEDDQLERVEFFDIEQSQQGYMTFTLPEDQPPLEAGETYRWKVILFCNPGRPSESRIDEADLVVVEPAADFDAPAAGDDPVVMAQQYAAAGLWYDAIATLAQAPVSPTVEAARSELVTSLAELEDANPDDAWSQFSERLRYIAGNGQ